LPAQRLHHHLDRPHARGGLSRDEKGNILTRHDEGWLIARKKTILENDRIPLAIDIYCL
jgi:hypothetical protein